MVQYKYRNSHEAMQITQLFRTNYRISGNIGDELNLAVCRLGWANRQIKLSTIFMNARFGDKSPNLMPTNITTYTVNMLQCVLLQQFALGIYTN